MQTIYKKIILWAAAFIFAALIIVLSVSLNNAKREMKRIKSNYDAQLSDQSYQQTLTPAELKKYFADEIARLKEYGVRTRNIENIVNVQYLYRDTLIYRDTLVWVYDTVTDYKFSPFDICTPCWSVFGKVIGDTVELYDVSVNDEIDVAIYREKRKCLFDKRRVKAIAISRCSGDTLRILRNIKVEK